MGYLEEIARYDSDERHKDYLAQARKSVEAIEVYKKCGDIYPLYQECIKREANLIKRIAGKVQCDEAYLAIFKYLFANGCFSYNDKFLFALDSSEVFYELGLSVTSGYGVCRNIAAHFLDVLNEIKKSDDKKCRNLLVCTRVGVTDRVIKHPPACFKNKISRNLNTELAEVYGDEEEEKVFFPNHAEVISLSKGKLTLYDPTRFKITRINTEREMPERKALDFRINIFRSSPWETYEEKERSLNICRETLPELEKCERKPLSLVRHLAFMHYGIEACQRNQDIINRFKERNRKYYEAIVAEKPKCYSKVKDYMLDA